MQPSCPWLSLVMRAGFTVMILRHGNNPTNGEIKFAKTKKGETGEKQSQLHAPRGWLTENSSWQAEQSIPHTTVTFYGD
jgi:hypothetical protein